MRSIAKAAKNSGLVISALMYEPTDGNNPSKPHKIGPFFLM